jgi:hypothetical protein
MGTWRRIVGRLDGWTTWGTSAVADEATAFLEGRLLESQRATGAGGRVPPWLWMNAVAHGDVDLLRELTTQPGRPASGAVGSWRSARAAVARELLERSGGDPDQLADLQQRALVPLECGLTDVPDLTPARLHEIVLAELWLTEN